MDTAYAIVALILIVLSIFWIIRPVPIPTPRLPPKMSLNLTTTPIISILILWAAQCLNPTVIRNGIVGTDGIKPYNIVILFFSLAYMAITLDISGLIRAAAYWVSNRGGNNGWKLYLCFYVLLTVASILLGHDPVILSGTTFLDHYTRVAELGPLPWLTAEFAVANTASMVLFVGNPTNVVICEGFGINNATFTVYTILPFIACSTFLFCFVASASQYYKRTPPVSTPTTHRDPWQALQDPVAACVGSFMLVTTLVLCFVVSFIGIDVWMISLPFAICKFLFDLGLDFCRTARDTPIEPFEAEEEGGEESSGASVREGVEHSRPVSPINHDIGSESGPFSESAVFDSIPGTSRTEPETVTAEGAQPPRRQDSQNSDKVDLRISLVKMGSEAGSDDSTSEGEPEDNKGDDSKRADHETTPMPSPSPHPSLAMDTNPSFNFRRHHSYMDSLQNRLFKRFPTVVTAFPRLPFGFVPYAFSQFILIEVLDHLGWVDIFGNWLVQVSNKQVYPTIWLIGVLGVILCNIPGARIGATILLTRVVRAAALPYDANRAAAIALAIASNVGAVSFTFLASLTDLLWGSILGKKEVHVKQRTFAFWNHLPILLLTTVGLGVVSAEMAVLFSL